MNTKYISSKVLKISVFSRVQSTSDFADIFNTRDQIVLLYLKTKIAFFLFFIFSLGENLFFPTYFSLNIASLSAFSGYNIGCKHSLHLENGL